MAISELKKKLYLYELKKLGFTDAKYISETEKIRLQPQNPNSTEINGIGEIRYSREDTDLVYNTLKPAIDRVTEISVAWEDSRVMPYEDLGQFRILAEYNGVILAARDDTDMERGLTFVTWQYSVDRSSLNHGHYTEDYIAAKEDFSIRSGLMSEEKVFTAEQASEIKASIKYRLENDEELTLSAEDTLNAIVEKLNSAYPKPDNIVDSLSPQENAHMQEDDSFEINKSASEVINGSVSTGDWVIVAKGGAYGYLVGQVTDIATLGSPEHDTGNHGDDIHVNFIDVDYSDERKHAILNQLSMYYGDDRALEMYALDDVIMSPDELIRIADISNINYAEFEALIKSQDAAEKYCKNVLDFHNGHKFEEFKECINKNLMEYRDSLSGFGQGELISMADKIAAITDAYNYVTNQYNFSQPELDFYLQFANPLEIIADRWIERNNDISDMYFVLNEIYDKQNVLADYPLISDVELQRDTSLRRYMDVDLELYLGKIAEKVIIHYPNDWKYDAETIDKIADSDNSEQKRLIWHVCDTGTHLKNERDVFVKNSGAYEYMTDYHQNDPDMFGYFIEVTGLDGKIIKGNIFEVGNYAEFAGHIRETALPLTTVTLTYSDDWGVNAGKTITVSHREYDEDRHRLMSESGKVKAVRFNPASEMELNELLRRERAKRMSLPLGSTRELLQKVADKLSEVRNTPVQAKQITHGKTTPRSLAEQLEAADKKVKAQDTSLNNNRPDLSKSSKRDALE